MIVLSSGSGSIYICDQRIWVIFLIAVVIIVQNDYYFECERVVERNVPLPDIGGDSSRSGQINNCWIFLLTCHTPLQKSKSEWANQHWYMLFKLPRSCCFIFFISDPYLTVFLRPIGSALQQLCLLDLRILSIFLRPAGFLKGSSRQHHDEEDSPLDP